MRIIDFYESDRQAHWLEQIAASEWDAGKLLHELLATGRFHTWAGAGSTVLLLTDGDTLAAYCTFAEQDDIQPAPYGPWIGFVYTAPAYRGQHLAGRLIRHAENLALWAGRASVHISTGYEGLYEKYGYRFRETLRELHGEPVRVYEKRLTRGGMLSVFHADSGRKYFSAEDWRGFIDCAADSGLDAVELTVGNGGWRFLLDDAHMALEAEGQVWPGEAVAAALREGNRAYHDCGVNELTEAEMEGILTHARERGVGVIPLLNSPGHMQAVVTAMQRLGVQGASYRGSESAADLESPAALGFVTALVRRYIDWFTARGVRAVNLGADEYANDRDATVPGFARLQEGGGEGYRRFLRYINAQTAYVRARGAVPLLFNDGMYYAGAAEDVDPHAISAYWCPGWKGYDLAPAALVAGKGHPVLNTNWAWYYVLGRSGEGKDAPDFSFEKALAGIGRVPGAEVAGDPGGVRPIGRMLCLWCDEPGAPYDATEKARVRELMRRFGEANPPAQA